MDRMIEAVEVRLQGKMDHMIEEVAAEFSRIREETNRRLELVDRRLDRVSEMLVMINGQMGALTRWADRRQDKQRDAGHPDRPATSD